MVLYSFKRTSKLLIHSIAAAVISWTLSMTWLNFLEWHSIIIWFMACYSLPQSHVGQYLSPHLLIIYPLRPWPVHSQFSTDYSCLGSSIALTPWLKSHISCLFTILELVYSLLRSLVESNPVLINSLADTHSGFLDFNLKVGESSNTSHNTECFPECFLSSVFLIDLITSKIIYYNRRYTLHHIA